MRICAAPDCQDEFEPTTHNQRYCEQRCKRDAENARRRQEVTERISSAIDEVYRADEAEDDEQLDYLRRENRRLTNLYNKHKRHKAEMVEAVHGAALEAMSKIEIKPVSPPRLTQRPGGDEEYGNPVVGDWQIGKRTVSYNSDICRDRIEIFGDKVERLTEIQRSDHPVNHAHVHAVGDMVEGEDIFPGQAFEVDSSLYRQIITGVEVLSDFLRRMLSIYETVNFTGVIGNHGLLSSKKRGDYNPETNMDRLLYKFVSMLFANEPRLTFSVPDGPGESNFYAVDYMGDYGVLLMHGDQLPQPTSGHGYYKKILGWKDTGIPERFDDVFIGHWHQNTKFTLGTTMLRIVGTPESDNSYAQERLGVMGRPSQHMQFVHPRRGVTAEYDVYLD